MRADKEKVGRLLRTARGQIDGVLRMIDEGQYCVDIANQVSAAQAVLRRANLEIVRAHMDGCVAEATASGDPALARQKVEEVTALLDKLTR